MTMTQIYASTDIASTTPVCAIDGTLYCNTLVAKGNRRIPAIAAVVDGKLDIVETSIKGNLSLVGKVGDNLLCGLAAPGKPQIVIVIDRDGNELARLTKGNQSVFASWSSDAEILAMLMGRDQSKAWAIYNPQGVIQQTLSQQYVGRAAGSLVPAEIQIDCAEGYSMPLARFVVGDLVLGAMFAAEKRTTANTCSWIMDYRDGSLEYLIPDGFADCDRFSANRATADGEWVFGLGFREAHQLGLAWSRLEGWSTIEDLLGSNLDFGSLVIDGDVIYGRASDGLYKVEGWRS